MTNFILGTRGSEHCMGVVQFAVFIFISPQIPCFIHRHVLKAFFSFSMNLSTGGKATLLNGSVTNIALFVGVGILALLILFCICWCCRAKVCSRCNPTDETSTVEYHRPGRNDKELSRVNSVV